MSLKSQILNTRIKVALWANLHYFVLNLLQSETRFFFLSSLHLLTETPKEKKNWCNYLLPNIRHLLCLDSVILGSGLSCCFVWFESACFSMAFMNLRKCLMYSGNVSRLQCPPPLIHKGSYFSLESSHSLFPWDQSTISSFVPCLVWVL